jgi:histidinol-phosphate aminotransferase
VRLHSNEHPGRLPAPLVAQIMELLPEVVAGLNRYPDPDATQLRAAMAAYLTATSGITVSAAQVWPGNGSMDVLQQLLLAYGGSGRSALAFDPTFAAYSHLSASTATPWTAVAPPSDPQTPGRDVAWACRVIARLQPDVVVLCSPNNPTGSALPVDTIRALYDAAQAGSPTLVVIDEAYVEFAAAAEVPGQVSALALLTSKRPNLVIVRTASKALGAAGLRLGCLVADPSIVDVVRSRVRAPYHLSTLTQVVGEQILQYSATHRQRAAEIARRRDRVAAALRDLGYDVAPSEGNFLLLGVLADERAAWRAFADRGIALRDVGIPGHLRVSIGSTAEMDAFLAAAAALRESHTIPPDAGPRTETPPAGHAEAGTTPR